MEAEDGAEEHAPEDGLPSTDGKDDDADDDLGDPVIFRQPDVELVFGEVGCVAHEFAGVLVESFAEKNPAHVRPPFTVARGVRIPGLIGVLVMDAVDGDPEDGSALERKGGTGGEEVFEPLGSAEAAMSEEAVVSEPNAERAGDPPHD